MIRGIVLAAGASSRMGQAKAALPLAQSGETLLARVVRSLLQGGVPDVTVVAGAHLEAVRAAAPRHEPRVRIIEHPGWQQGQLSSLLAGLNAIDTPLLEGVLVMLVDVPLVKPSTVSAVIAEWRRTRAPIVRPVMRGARGAGEAGETGEKGEAGVERHGHPVIFDRAVFQDLRDADPAVGAKAVFAKHRLRIVNVEVDDPGAFEDIDTPEDYERLNT